MRDHIEKRTEKKKVFGSEFRERKGARESVKK